MKFTDISETQERSNIQKFLDTSCIQDRWCQNANFLSRKCQEMSCVNTFPKHSVDGGQYGASVHYPFHQFRTHDIYGHSLNGKEQTALVHYN